VLDIVAVVAPGRGVWQNIFCVTIQTERRGRCVRIRERSLAQSARIYQLHTASYTAGYTASWRQRPSPFEWGQLPLQSLLVAPPPMAVVRSAAISVPRALLVAIGAIVRGRQSISGIILPRSACRMPHRPLGRY
jgi:hypothetical protein